jgi:hypothetical protein
VYYRQKGEVIFDTAAHRDTRLAQVAAYLSNKSTRSKFVAARSSPEGAALTIIVDYDTKADADQVWADVQAMRDTAEITGGFMGYGSVAETDLETGELYGYRWWY